MKELNLKNGENKFIKKPRMAHVLSQQRSLGSGGGASGRAMAFCPSEPGLNPGTDLAFFGNATLFSLGVGQYLKRTGHKKCYILFILLSCFLSFKHCE